MTVSPASADPFRRAYVDARAAGYSGTRREFARLVPDTGLFSPRLRAGAGDWVREHLAPDATTQRQHGGRRLRWAGVTSQGGLYLQVVEQEEEHRD